MISDWVGSDRVGSIIEGRYPLQRWLGGADESGVFLTHVAGRPPRNAAIKIIPAGIADPESLLDQWIKAKRRVHRHLIQLYDAGRCRIDDCDLLYTVTDCADEILSEILPARVLTPAEVREMLDSLLETLSWLHDQGLVHGGLRPSNIMVVNEQIKLSVDRIQPAARRIFPVLSPGAYEAPESAGTIAPAADIWSLGVLLVESLTRNPPPWNGTAYRIPGSVPEPFAVIASECLRLDPARRCSLRDIRSRLAPAAHGFTPLAPVSTPPVPAEATHAAPSEKPAAGSPAPPANPFPDLLPIPAGISVPDAPAHLAGRVAALFEPAPRVVVAPIAPTAPPSFEEPAVPGVAAAAEAATAPVVPSSVGSIAYTPADVPLAEAEKLDSPAPADDTPKSGAPALVAEASSIDMAAPPASAESPAVSRGVPILSVQGQPALEASDQPAIAQPSAYAAHRRVSIPAAEPIKAAQKPRRNRVATTVASAMVLIAAGLMLTIALHLTSRRSSPVPKSSPANEPPARPVPQPQSALPLASNMPAPNMPAPVAPAPAPQTASGIPAGAITPGAVVHRVLPNVTQRALDTIRGRLVVIVRVQVDSTGNVTGASYAYEGSSHYLKTAALEAAQNWKFQPAEIGGRPVPSTWDLQFWFDRTGPSTTPIEKTP